MQQLTKKKSQKNNNKIRTKQGWSWTKTDNKKPKHHPRGVQGGGSVPASKVCDFVADCTDATDEAACGNCTFEAGLCGYRQAGDDDMDWTLQAGPTPSGNTGPDHDHTLGTPAGAGPENECVFSRVQYTGKRLYNQSCPSVCLSASSEFINPHSNWD